MQSVGDVVGAKASEQNLSARRSLGNVEKMNIMRERFKMLQLSEELEDKDNKIIDDDSKDTKTDRDEKVSEEAKAPPVTPAAGVAASKWNKLKKVIRTDTGKSGGSMSPRLASPRVQTPRNAETIEQEDANLMDFWAQRNPVSLDDILFDMDTPIELDSKLESEFQTGAPPLAVTVNRIPEEVVTQQKEKIQLAMYEEQSKVLDNIKRKEVDVIWREHLARERLVALEEESKRRIEVEKEKLMKLAKEKETLLGRNFRQVREELEEGLKRQQGAVKEHFGKVLVHEEVSVIVLERFLWLNFA